MIIINAINVGQNEEKILMNIIKLIHLLIILGLLIGLRKEKPFEGFSNKFFIKTFKPDFLSVNKRNIDYKYIKKYKKNNPVLIWTIKTREDFTKYKDKGTSLVLENINMI